MSQILTEQKQRVRVLTLNRPKRRNALSGELIAELRSELRAAEADPETGAVVLTGAGPVFCAGGDLKGSAMGDGFAQGHAERGAFADLLADLRQLKVPVVAAVQGDAMGGGFGLASGCDLIVASSEARFGTPEIKLGLFPWIILVTLLRDVPRKPLLELVLTGGKWSAARAESLGLVNQVVAPDEVLDAAVALGTTIAARSPLIVGLGKVAFHQVEDQRFADALRFMHGQLSMNLLTEDAMEGIAAFLQKRDPQWKGR